MTAADRDVAYQPGAPVWVDLGGTWQRGHVVALEHPDRCAWWPGVDFRCAVPIRLDPGSGVPGAGCGVFDLLIPDPASDKLMPRHGTRAPRAPLEAVTVR